MKISELEAELARIKKEKGDIDVKIQTLSHLWNPELKVKVSGIGTPYLLLNS